jgi:site-specific recombinase XerD
MQKAMKEARHRAEIPKPASCHTLRQSFAPISRIIAAVEKTS